MATAPPAATAHIRFRCPHCGKTNKAPTGMIGCGGTCARCKGGVKVPAVGDRTAGPVMREVGIAKPAAEKVAATPNSVRTLEELGEFVAERQGKRKDEPAAENEPQKAKPRRTPWWLWVLHLSLPVATVIVVGAIYQARQAGAKSSTAVVEKSAESQPAAPDSAPTEAAPALLTSRTR